MQKLTLNQILTARTDECVFCKRVMLLIDHACAGCYFEIVDEEIEDRIGDVGV